MIKSDFINIKNKYVSDLIKNMVKKINKKKIIIKINSIEYILSLKDKDDDSNDSFFCSNYELKECDPNNLKPVNHSDRYSPNTSLKELINKKISFVSKNPINIMLIENYDSCKNGYINNKYKGEIRFENNYFSKCISNCFYNLFDFYNISSDI